MQLHVVGLICCDCQDACLNNVQVCLHTFQPEGGNRNSKEAVNEWQLQLADMCRIVADSESASMTILRAGMQCFEWSHDCSHLKCVVMKPVLPVPSEHMRSGLNHNYLENNRCALHCCVLQPVAQANAATWHSKAPAIFS